MDAGDRKYHHRMAVVTLALSREYGRYFHPFAAQFEKIAKQIYWLKELTMDLENLDVN